MKKEKKMATCEKCGASFKPYWQFMDVEEHTCENCAHQADKKKGQRLVLAFTKVVLGIIAIAVSVLLLDSFFLQLAGFVVLIFGLLKLVEVAIIGQKASPQKS
jgi:hypothetical protein